jgi:hypothetical protein
MRFDRITLLASVLLISSAIPASATPKVRRGPTATRLLKSKAAKPKASMEPERATAIQTALIKAGYMTGTPSGAWDAPTQAAMEKLQADNGWQTKLVPDARAIIKLGLGPNTPSPVAANAAASEEREEPSAIAPEPAAAVPAASNN